MIIAIVQILHLRWRSKLGHIRIDKFVKKCQITKKIDKNFN